MGWDAFGLPAEQYALQTGVHPAITTQKAMENFRRQLKRLGFSYDWSREISTCDPKFYKWTQFIFLKLYEKGLAYQKEVPVNWCPALKTVLANEEVVDGMSERGSHPVFRVPMKQWMLKITAYAERLLERSWMNWIGQRVLKNFKGIGSGEAKAFKCGFLSQTKKMKLKSYTRPDTIFGVTYMVLAPEHPFVDKLTTSGQKAQIKAYQEKALKNPKFLGKKRHKKKRARLLDHYAMNPVNEEKIPIWIC